MAASVASIASVLSFDAADESSPPLSRTAKTMQDGGAVLEGYASTHPTLIQELRRDKSELLASVVVLSEENAMIPELERELLHHADRADKLTAEVSKLAEKNRALEVLAHARCRSKEHISAARIIRSLGRSRRDQLTRNSFLQWKMVMMLLR